MIMKNENDISTVFKVELTVGLIILEVNMIMVIKV